MLGKCKFWKRNRTGNPDVWGIISTDGGEDFFCHFSNIDARGFRALSDGQPCEFEAGPGKDGKPSQALHVRPIGVFEEAVLEEEVA
jgi:cold shock CspA family protein